ncbi:hypothetical protein BS50DRAFT_212594 [Corynespora cassiicola Philippines]|uniref:Secreted protein n=1 Tax=Corynespora cassiicola Philippines TaxID=1448308 RepID=A0A2T2N487_CORCC|nr:hypothetical protein BS50DRAFT_212594 [Corynespora cassiicola Philippines]
MCLCVCVCVCVCVCNSARNPDLCIHVSRRGLSDVSNVGILWSACWVLFSFFVSFTHLKGWWWGGYMEWDGDGYVWVCYDMPE